MEAILQTQNRIDITNDLTTNNRKIDISFQNISYYVKTKKYANLQKKFIFSTICPQKVEKKILNNVSGACRAGEITAIMGASGCGKTTLLNILTGRIQKPDFEGKIMANQVQYDFQQFKKFGNYVHQKDILYQSLNVRQTLQFAGMISSTKSQQQIQNKIKQLVKILKLQNCLDTFIGGTSILGRLFKGISGGQRKRLAIAYEILCNPKVLILDQPTSGLDSFTAYLTIRLLKNMAVKEDMNIILTIHQPNHKIYNLIDRLIFLTKGCILYQGSREKAFPYFQNMAFKSQSFQNPSDFIISITHPLSTFNLENFEKMRKNYIETYDSNSIENKISNQNENIIFQQRDKPNFCCRFKIMLKRQLINIKRNPLVLYFRIVTNIVTGLLLGGIYFQFDKDLSTPGNAKSILAFSNYIGVQFLVHQYAPLIFDFPVEKEVYIKQSNAGVYKPIDYYLSKFVTQMPMVFISATLFSILVYFMTGLYSQAKQFFIFWFIIFLVGVIGGGLGLLTGSLVDDPKAAGTVATAVILPICLFSGIFKNRYDLREYFRWIEYLMCLKYSFNGIALNQLEAGNYIGGKEVINQINFEFSVYQCIYCLIGLAVGFKILGFIFLLILKRKVV